jgi:hypothetical protein
MVMWSMFEPKREEVTDGWRKLHNEIIYYHLSYAINYNTLRLAVYH